MWHVMYLHKDVKWIRIASFVYNACDERCVLASNSHILQMLCYYHEFGVSVHAHNMIFRKVINPIIH